MLIETIIKEVDLLGLETLTPNEGMKEIKRKYKLSNYDAVLLYRQWRKTYIEKEAFAFSEEEKKARREKRKAKKNNKTNKRGRKNDKII